MRSNIQGLRKSERIVTDMFSDKISVFSALDGVDYISCHGHTVKHIDKVLSIQLLDAKRMYERFGIPVVYNFRQNDIKCGGNGAPLMPFLDSLIFNDKDKDYVTLNIGGISNISFIPNIVRSIPVLGFDTGPGMSLIDKASDRFFNEPCDRNAIFSSIGSVDNNLLDELMSDKFILKKPPKSTDIDYFGFSILNLLIKNYVKIDPNDLLRTLVQFTVESINFNINQFLNLDSDYQLVCSGGGVYHPIVYDSLSKSHPDVCMISKYGIDPSIKEALLIAVLGACRILRIKSNLPSVTGAKSKCLQGDIYSGN